MKKIAAILIILLLFIITSCGGKSDKTLTKIELSTSPKTEYYLDDMLDVSGGVVTAYFDDDSTTRIELTPGMVSGFDSSTEGSKTITISYKYGDVTKTISFEINVISNIALTGLTIDKMPDKTSYFDGDRFIVTGLVVSAHYSDGTSKQLKNNQISFSAVFLSAGTKYVIGTYNGLSIQIAVEVKEIVVSKIEITKLPNKTTYYEGDEFDNTGMIVNATYNNGKTETVTNYLIDKPVLALGDTVINIYYQGSSTSLNVVVKELILDKIIISHDPDKIEYKEGEKFDPKGMIISAVYNSGKTVEINDYDYSPKDELSSLDNIITISYLGKSVTLEIIVTSLSGTIKKVELKSGPTKTSYYYGQILDLTGAVIKITLTDDSVEEINVINRMLGSYSMEVTGEQTIDINYVNNGTTYKMNFKIYVSECYSVSNIFNVNEGINTVVEGVFVGYAGNGNSSDNGIIIRDLENDDYIIVRNIDMNLNKGDYLRLIVTVAVSNINGYSEKGMKSLTFIDSEYDNETINSLCVLGHNHYYEFDLSDSIIINTQDDFVSAFTNRTDLFYDFLKLSGTFYLVYYASSGTEYENGYFRIYFDDSITALADQKIDGLSPVFRNCYQNLNLGVGFAEEVLGISEAEAKASSYSSPIVFSGDIYAMYTGGNKYYHQLVILDWSFISDIHREYPNKEKYQDIIKTVAYAYYYQGNTIQYDQSNYRRNINAYPELATSQNIIYLDCSSYVNSVYRYVFGRNIISTGATTYYYNEYAKNNIGKSADVIYYINNADYTTSTSQKEILNEVMNALEVGDLINYRHGSSASNLSGHVMMYVGNGYFLHSTGSSYHYNSDPESSYDQATAVEASNGTVQLLKISEVFTNTSSSRYLFKSTSSDSIYSFSLIRPLNQTGLKLTEQAANRYYADGLVMETSSSADLYDAVFIGDNYTIEVSLDNKASSSIYGLNVTMALPSGLAVLDNSITAGGVLVGDEVRWYVRELKPNQNMVLSFDALVSSDASGTIEFNGNVNKMPLNPFVNTVSKLSQTDLEAVGSKALELINNTSYSDSFAFVNAVYKSVINKNMTSDYTSIKDMINDLIDTANNTCFNNTKASKMLVKNLYGGISINSGYTADYYRSRKVLEANLTIGDIILVYNSYNAKYQAYVYTGNNSFCYVENGTVTKLSNGVDTNRMFTTRLISYSRYVVIRPSMVLSK